MAKELTTSTFDVDVVQNSKPLVVKTYASWCGPCVQMAPIFDEVAQEFESQLDFFELNVDQSRDLAIKFGITSIPTILFIKDGQIMRKEIGYMDVDDLRTKVQQFLNALSG